MRKLRLRVVYNTPVRDKRAGVTAEGHPPSQATADAGEQYPASARVQGRRKSVYCRSDVAESTGGKGNRAAPPTFVTAIQHAVTSCRSAGSASSGRVSWTMSRSRQVVMGRLLTLE